MTDQTTVNPEAAQPVTEDSVPAPTHASIAAAIIAAMAEVKRLEKGAQNREQGYKFASIDDFLAMVNPICAKHGLIPIMEEQSVELVAKKGRYGDQDWLSFTYLITLHHVSGSSIGPLTRRVEVLRSGAQAYGSAQSYVLKQFLRGLLLIATGDKDDPDFGRDPARDMPDNRGADRRGDGGNGGQSRQGNQTQQRNDSRPRQQTDLAAMVARLADAKTGRELYEACKAIPGPAHATAEVAEARIEALRNLVKGATSKELLEEYQRNFKPDWESVAGDAAYRAEELELELELAERRKADAEDRLRQRREAAAQGQTQQQNDAPTSGTANADLGNDDIPY